MSALMPTTATGCGPPPHACGGAGWWWWWTPSRPRRATLWPIWANLTCEVTVDQLEAVRRPVANRSQAELLAANGLGDLVAEARRTWQERAAVGDLAAAAARSRVIEADALTDPAGLGASWVLEWVV